MSTKQDIRTLVFGKIRNGLDRSFDTAFDCLEFTKEKRGLIHRYVTWGNSDFLVVYSLNNIPLVLEGAFDHQDNRNCYNLLQYEKKKIASCFSKNGSTDTEYFCHTLHIVKYVEDDDDLKQFWDKEAQYMVVTHVYDTSHNTLASEKNLDQFVSKANVEYQVYRSINMSDLVVVWKSDILSDILQDICTFNQTFRQMMTQSICGVLYDRSDYPESEHDTLGMISLSGTIKASAGGEGVEYLKECFCSVASFGTSLNSFGNKDVMMTCQDISTKKLVEIVKKWYSSEGSDVWDTFQTLSVTLYTEMSYPSNDNDDTQHKYHLKTEKLIKQYNKVLSNYLEYEWAYPLLESFNLLLNMSKNPSLSRAMYFVADNVIGFCEALSNNQKSADENMLSYNKERIIRFSTALHMLINRLVRVDGYLNQEPAYSLLVYNMIPAGILEYYYSFIYKVFEFMHTHFDNHAKCQYSMLLLPELARRVKIVDVLYLNPQNQTPVFPEKQVYFVEIPYDMLYKPKELLLCVTHEIMHFCGESCRCRQERYKSILGFASDYIAWEFECSKSLYDVSNCIYEYFDNVIDYKKSGQYLDVLEEELKDQVVAFYSDIPIRNHLCNIEHEKEQSANLYDIIMRINQKSLIMSLRYHIPNVFYLFKECYADLATLYLLEMPIYDYIDAFCTEITLAKQRNKNTVYPVFVQRIALVIYVLCDRGFLPHNFELTNQEDNNSTKTRIIKDVKKVLLNLECASKGQELPIELLRLDHFPWRCLLHVADYLKACYKKFQIKNSSSGKAFNNIKRYYSIGQDNDNFFDDEYFDIIEKNRQRIKELFDD